MSVLEFSNEFCVHIVVCKVKITNKSMNIPRFARDLQLYSCIAIEIFLCSFITLTFSFVLSVVSGVTKGTSCKKKFRPSSPSFLANLSSATTAF